MGIFKEIYCSDCGEKVGILTRTKLKDEKYICSKCTHNIPTYIMKCVSKSYNFEDYKALKEYIRFSDENLKPRFNETASYQNFHIDELSKLFYIDASFLKEPLYMQFINVSYFNMEYLAESVKKGFFGDRVYGSVTVELIMETPSFTYSKVLANDVKAKANISFFKTKVTYAKPKEMEEFVFRFMTAWNNAVEDEQQKHQQKHQQNYRRNYEDASVSITELEKAKILFMLDDIDDITLEDIRKQRNKLIRMFHPDTSNDSDTKYAQKINNAYEILKKAIEK